MNFAAFSHRTTNNLKSYKIKFFGNEQKVDNVANIGIKDFLQLGKKITPNLTRSCDHWFKGLMLNLTFGLRT